MEDQDSSILGIKKRDDAMALLTRAQKLGDAQAYHKVQVAVAKRLTKLAQEAENKHRYDVAEDLEYVAAGIAYGLGDKDRANPFHEAKDPMLHRRFQKAVSDKAIQSLEEYEQEAQIQQGNEERYMDGFPPREVEVWQQGEPVGMRTTPVVSNETYRQVSADLKHLSKTLNNEDKAIKAGSLADQLAQYSEKNPAPHVLQDQIKKYETKRDVLTRTQEKHQTKETEELGL